MSGNKRQSSVKVGEFQPPADSSRVGAKAVSDEKTNDDSAQACWQDNEMSFGTGEGVAEIRPDIVAIREAQSFLAGYFAATRLITAPYLSGKTGNRVYLKLEAELPTGSFKVRGALLAWRARVEEGRDRGGKVALPAARGIMGRR